MYKLKIFLNQNEKKVEHLTFANANNLDQILYRTEDLRRWQ